jgi:hypothetical protein
LKGAAKFYKFVKRGVNLMYKRFAFYTAVVFNPDGFGDNVGNEAGSRVIAAAERRARGSFKKHAQRTLGQLDGLAYFCHCSDRKDLTYDARSIVALCLAAGSIFHRLKLFLAFDGAALNSEKHAVRRFRAFAG